MAVVWPYPRGPVEVRANAAVTLALTRRALRSQTPVPPSSAEYCCPRCSRFHDAADARLGGCAAASPGPCCSRSGNRAPSPPTPGTPRCHAARPGSAGRRLVANASTSSLPPKAPAGAAEGYTSARVSVSRASRSPSAERRQASLASERRAPPAAMLASGERKEVEDGAVSTLNPMLANALSELTDGLRDRLLAILGYGYPHNDQLRSFLDQRSDELGLAMGRSWDELRAFLGWRAVIRSALLWRRLGVTNEQVRVYHHQLVDRDGALRMAGQEKRSKLVIAAIEHRLLDASERSAVLIASFGSWRRCLEVSITTRNVACLTDDLAVAVANEHHARKLARRAFGQLSDTAVHFLLGRCFLPWARATFEAKRGTSACLERANAEAGNIKAARLAFGVGLGALTARRGSTAACHFHMRACLIAWVAAASREKSARDSRAVEDWRQSAEARRMRSVESAFAEVERRLGAAHTVRLYQCLYAWAMEMHSVREAESTKRAARRCEEASAALRSKLRCRLARWYLEPRPPARGMPALWSVLAWRYAVMDARLGRLSAKKWTHDMAPSPRPQADAGGHVAVQAIMLGRAAMSATQEQLRVAATTPLPPPCREAPDACGRSAIPPSRSVLEIAATTRAPCGAVASTASVPRYDDEHAWRREIERRKAAAKAARYGHDSAPSEPGPEPVDEGELLSLASQASASEAGFHELLEYHRRQGRSRREALHATTAHEATKTRGPTRAPIGRGRP